ncbi:MAG TPA: hypothetical protein PK165_06600 [bacterium]|nr:hypothetical protein [bacterium]
MKRNLFLLCGICFIVQTAIAQELDFSYKFPVLESLIYRVNINGNAGWSSFDEKMSNFKVRADFLMELVNLGESEGLYQLKLTAKKSKIIVNEDIFEDTTWSDTEISSFIPQLLLQMDKKGKVHKTTILKRGLLDFAPFIGLFPVFPETITQGTRWVQKIESFNFPSGKIPQLEFTYMYEGSSKGNEKIKFLSNQIIKTTSKQQDTEVKITGKNNSDGEILFDAAKGIITKTAGKLNLDVNYMFQVPDPNKKGKFLPVPMRIMLNINFSFIPLN